MKKVQILEHFWRGASEKEGWYPPYADALKDVDATLAAWRAEGVASNTIWETVVHLIYYKERLLRRLQGIPEKPLASNDETFQIYDDSATAWPPTVARLFELHEQLLIEIQKLDDDGLDQLKPEEPIGAQFFNLIVHDAYHTGQIIMIRKLKGAWPEKRSFL